MAMEDIIAEAARRHGVPAEAMIGIAQIESAMNPGAKNPSSSAGGLFQFIDSTARGYGLQDRYDPVQASDAAARLARDNAAYLRRSLGREPTPGELYLAHQQGAGGAANILRNPNARAVDVLGADQVRLNVPGGMDWRNMTTGQFADLWSQKLANALPQQQQSFDQRLEAAIAPTPIPQQVAQGISGLVNALSPQNVARGISGMLSPQQSAPPPGPQFFEGNIAYGAPAQATDGRRGMLSSTPGRMEFDERVHGRDMSIMRANREAIREATGLSRINQDSIDKALAAGATLYRPA